MSKRLARVSGTLQHELSDIIKKETSDPRLEDLIITEVDVSPDLRYAVVYISTLTSDVNQALEALKKAKGYLKKHIGRHLKMRYLPDLEFREDKSLNHAMKIESMIKKIRGKE